MNKYDFLNRNSLSGRQIILWSTFFFGLVMASIITGALSMWLSGETRTLLTVSIVLQDILVFILPAFITARFISAQPFTFLKLTTAPQWRAILFVVLLLVISMPAMNYIVYLNEQLSLPEALAPIEAWMRATENAAKAVTDSFLSGNTLPQMLGCILLMGVLTGLSEEMLFRGALQGTLLQSRNTHFSIWLAAFVFSVLHFQFFGFVPRLLLGAIFGYLLVWTGSLWVPIIAHTLNNSVVVVSSYFFADNASTDIISSALGSALENIGVPTDGSFPKLAFISLILTYFLIRYRQYILKPRHSE